MEKKGMGLESISMKDFMDDTANEMKIEDLESSVLAETSQFISEADRETYAKHQAEDEDFLARMELENAKELQSAANGAYRTTNVSDNLTSNIPNNISNETTKQSAPSGTESGKSGKKAKKNGVSVAWIFLFFSTTVLALMGCVYFYFQNEKTKTQVDEAKETITVMESDDKFSQDAMDAYAKAESEAAVSEAMEEMRASIKYSVENESIITMLRNVFPEELIIAADGKYNFIPIDESFPMNNLVAEQYVVNENGTMDYVDGDGNLISHKGIDVARFQGNIDWNKVAADGVRFAIIRIGLRGYGTGEVHLDANFHQNITGAINAGIDVGVYFYSQAITEEEALEEANFIIENLGDYKLKLPVVMDIEYVDGDNARANALTKEERTTIAKTFCEAITEAGYEAMVYGNMKTFLMMLDMTQLREYKTWFAYYNYPIYYPYEFTIWQYSESGKVDGIDAAVDLNMIIGDYPWE